MDDHNKLQILINLITLLAASDLPCIPRHFGPGNIVCVCNATYCDTIDKGGINVPPGQYVQYTTNKKGLRFARTTGSFGQATPLNGNIFQ